MEDGFLILKCCGGEARTEGGALVTLCVGGGEGGALRLRTF